MFITFFIISYIVEIFFLIVKQYKTKAWDFLEPYFVFIFGFSLYMWTGYYYQVNIVSLDSNASFIYGLCILITVLFFNIGYIFTKPNNISQLNNYGVYLKPYGSRILTVILLISILILFLNLTKLKEVLWAFQIGGQSYLTYSIRPTRTIITGPLALMQKYYMNIFMFVICLFYFYFGKFNIISLMLTILLIIYGVCSGDRILLIFVIIVNLVFYNYHIRRITLFKGTSCAVISLLLLIFIAHARVYNNMSDILDFLFTRQLSDFSLFSIGELTAGSKILSDYIIAIQHNEYMFDLGKSVVTDFIMFIPFFLFPNRPLPLAEQYMISFHPEAPAGTGMGYNILCAPYLSYGLVGVAIQALLLGFLMKKSYVIYRKNANNLFICFIYCIILTQVITLSRGSFGGALKNIFLLSLPFYIINIALKKRF